MYQLRNLNRLSKQNHQGAIAQIAPISFYTIENLVESVLESDKNTSLSSTRSIK